MKIEQRNVWGLEWEAQVKQTALLATPVYIGQAQGKEKRHTKRSQNWAAGLAPLLIFWIGPHASSFPGGSEGKASACNAGDLDSIPVWGRSPGKGNATHPIILAWKTTWMQKPCGLQSVESERVKHNWATSLSLSCLKDVFACQIKLRCNTGPSVASIFAAARQNWGNYKHLWHITKRKKDHSNPKIRKMIKIST